MPEHWGLPSSEPEAKVNHGGQYPGSGRLVAFRTTPEYTYVAADLRKVYGEKCRETVRQFIHLQPNVFVVYDRVGASDPSYRKEWLLHFQNEPKVDGRDVVADCDRGRLFCRTLLPADASLRTVGGPGKEFWASGKNWELDPKFLKAANYNANRCGKGPYFGNWRLEVAPSAPAADDRFLHVLVASDQVADGGVTSRYVKDGNRDVAFVEMADGTVDGVRGRVRVAVGFNRTGEIGAEIRAAVYGPDGAKLKEKTEKLANAVESQSGVLL